MRKLLFFLCRSISKVWHRIHKNLLWSVKDGNSIQCWCDPWIPNCDPLFVQIPSLTNLNMDCPLSSMVAGNGS